MVGRARRIVHEAQRDPAGVEVGLDPVLVARGRGGGADHVGGVGVAVVEQLARKQAALGPPFIAVDQRGAVARRRLHQVGGVHQLVRATQLLHLGQDQTGVLAQRVRNGGDRLVAAWRFGDHRGACLLQRDHVGAGGDRVPQRGRRLLLVHEPIGLVLVVAAREVRAELGLELPLEVGLEVALAEQRACQLGAVGDPARALERLGQRELARRGDRGRRFVEAHDRDGIPHACGARLGLMAKPGRCRPVGMGVLEGVEPLHADLLGDIAQRDPLQRRAHERIRDTRR